MWPRFRGPSTSRRPSGGPGDPFSSVLYYRISKTGPGRMPHIGSEIVDSRGVETIHDWIRSLPQKSAIRMPIRRKKRRSKLVLAIKGTSLKKDPALAAIASSTPGAYDAGAVP